ncbi:major fimbrial protein StkA [Serratia entomophila]|uniref:Type 1 fimbrial protein n=2 Tax=Serratia entomophila TaxID=42906 RepID=A0ABY5CZ18_9GAMM|nr:fimbrial protein [Serratia entomophila]UIW20061.1 type 1 fimbrial protein [Serratia entomophila]USV02582.1 type 1 fimbrial protein [Serratia entomophila]CAI0708391.1 major fimbrial protein StkA [Serratia entomophila]CAI0738327.1 major fimbrial protein StkA [Serratia entomophila]CAI0748022.1 major fimbrial protein StkA [Serratia entomophila]
MIKQGISLAVLAAALSSASAMAADNAAGGVISFSGAVTDTTCTINGGKSADFTVALSPISVTDAGTVVGPITKNKKSFSLTFSGCTPAAGTAGTPLKIYFSSANNISTDGKYLLNGSVNESDEAVAKNVGFSLAEPGSSTPIPLNVPYLTKIKGDKTAPESETLTLDAYYYKTNVAAAKVGELSSNVTYTISYL